MSTTPAHSSSRQRHTGRWLVVIVVVVAVAVVGAGHRPLLPAATATPPSANG